jgi:long-chain acyl-CoA synthetase
MTAITASSHTVNEYLPPSIRTILETRAKMYPNRTALQLGRQQLTYSHLQEAVVSMAAHLKVSGVTPDDPVVLLFQNTPTCIIAFLALAWLNAGVIPLGPEVSCHELEAIFDDISFGTILGEKKKLARLKKSFSQPGCSFVDPGTLMMKPRNLSVVIDAEAAPSDRMFVYHYTSGSTGEPKAALHAQSNLINGGFIYQQTYNITAKDSILGAVPLYHSFGMVAGLIAALLCGSRLVLFERFIPHQVMKTLANERITILLAVPFMYDLMTRCYLPDVPDLGALRVCLSSGASLSPHTAKQFEDKYNRSIYQVYGSTETGVIAAQWPNGHNWPAESAGCPLRGVQMRIVGEDGQELSPDESGHLWVKTPAMFAGYLNRIEVTQRVFQDGWYLTGDMARQDNNGYLYLVGRKDTFINVGGKKVNPLEVEKVLLSHPLVKEAVVFGSDAGSAGQQVQAKIVGRNVSAVELLAFCRDQLAFYKVPTRIEFLTDLPKTSLGKVRRKV